MDSTRKAPKSFKPYRARKKSIRSTKRNRKLAGAGTYKKKKKPGTKSKQAYAKDTHDSPTISQILAPLVPVSVEAAEKNQQPINIIDVVEYSNPAKNDGDYKTSAGFCAGVKIPAIAFEPPAWAWDWACEPNTLGSMTIAASASTTPSTPSLIIELQGRQKSSMESITSDEALWAAAAISIGTRNCTSKLNNKFSSSEDGCELDLDAQSSECPLASQLLRIRRFPRGTLSQNVGIEGVFALEKSPGRNMTTTIEENKEGENPQDHEQEQKQEEKEKKLHEENLKILTREKMKMKRIHQSNKEFLKHYQDACCNDKFAENAQILLVPAYGESYNNVATVSSTNTKIAKSIPSLHCYENLEKEDKRNATFNFGSSAISTTDNKTDGVISPDWSLHAHDGGSIKNDEEVASIFDSSKTDQCLAFSKNIKLQRQLSSGSLEFGGAVSSLGSAFPRSPLSRSSTIENGRSFADTGRPKSTQKSDWKTLHDCGNNLSFQVPCSLKNSDEAALLQLPPLLPPLQFDPNSAALALQARTMSDQFSYYWPSPSSSAAVPSPAVPSSSESSDGFYFPPQPPLTQSVLSGELFSRGASAGTDALLPQCSRAGMMVGGVAAATVQNGCECRPSQQTHHKHHQHLLKNVLNSAIQTEYQNLDQLEEEKIREQIKALGPESFPSQATPAQFYAGNEASSSLVTAIVAPGCRSLKKTASVCGRGSSGTIRDSKARGDIIHQEIGNTGELGDGHFKDPLIEFLAGSKSTSLLDYDGFLEQQKGMARSKRRARYKSEAKNGIDSLESLFESPDRVHKTMCEETGTCFFTYEVGSDECYDADDDGSGFYSDSESSLDEETVTSQFLENLSLRSQPPAVVATTDVNSLINLPADRNGAFSAKPIFSDNAIVTVTEKECTEDECEECEECEEERELELEQGLVYLTVDGTQDVKSALEVCSKDLLLLCREIELPLCKDEVSKSLDLNTLDLENLLDFSHIGFEEIQNDSDEDQIQDGTRDEPIFKPPTVCFTKAAKCVAAALITGNCVYCHAPQCSLGERCPANPSVELLSPFENFNLYTPENTSTPINLETGEEEEEDLKGTVIFSVPSQFYEHNSEEILGSSVSTGTSISLENGSIVDSSSPLLKLTSFLNGLKFGDLEKYPKPHLVHSGSLYPYASQDKKGNEEGEVLSDSNSDSDLNIDRYFGSVNEDDDDDDDDDDYNNNNKSLGSGNNNSVISSGTLKRYSQILNSLATWSMKKKKSLRSTAKPFVDSNNFLITATCSATYDDPDTPCFDHSPKNSSTTNSTDTGVLMSITQSKDNCFMTLSQNEDFKNNLASYQTDGTTEKKEYPILWQ
ncbi:uncharacterized protein SAPINGB_P003690 [Magnusiomyces paraingens]|uniref:Uncharacterized protein n=1 Tax=Magnusiomyces paraingens TaxID=2606893 RepID=A0A5E8BSX4_9ASCO|nr:uncharacterized protein SAPINGB_P003690 [Saprochaete ingens]VVT53669.1 unnamed protein product [Saprochaete ingens]